MKSKLNFLAGLIAGILMVTCTGMASAISETVTAVLTTSPIYLDGEQVAIKGYNIAGHNYFQLRDIGEQLGFNVYWSDGAVFIDSQSPYTGVPIAIMTVSPVLHWQVQLSSCAIWAELREVVARFSLRK